MQLTRFRKQFAHKRADHTIEHRSKEKRISVRSLVKQKYIKIAVILCIEKLKIMSI